MNKYRLLNWFSPILLLIVGTLMPALSTGQSVITISGPTTACVGDVPTYSFSPVNNDLIYTWTVSAQGNVLSSAANTALIEWVSAGTAIITIEGRDTAHLLKAQGTLSVTIMPSIHPVINASQFVNCQPLDPPNPGDEHVDFKDSSSCQKACAYSQITYSVAYDPNSTYTWIVNGDVSHSSAQNTCVVNWGSPGAGEVSVTQTNGSCSGTASVCITIIEGPKAHFSTMPNMPDPNNIEVCLNSTVIFIDESTSPSNSPIVSWVWNFGDGNTSSAGPGTIGGPIQHTYTQPGGYQASLTVTNSCGCSSTYSININVKSEEGVIIECPRVSCEGEKINYYIRELTCDDGKWDADGGTVLSQNNQKATVIWDNIGPAGFGYLSYITECGDCPGITTVAIPVIQQLGTIQGPTSVCPNTQYKYSLPQWPTTEFTWQVSGNATILPTDQPNEIALTTGNSGSFTLGVSYCNTLIKCLGEASLTGTIMPPASINGATLVCINDQKTYTLNGASLATWILSPPTGSPVNYSNIGSISPTFTQSGTYTLSISGDFCAPEPIKIKVRDKPAPPSQILGPDKACVGEPVFFTAQTPLAGTLFQWYATPGTVNSGLGDGTYASFSSLPAEIKVVRISTDAAQCVSDTLRKTIEAEMPVVSMSTNAPATVCGSTQWNFDLNYDNADLYEWKVLDPSGSV